MRAGLVLPLAVLIAACGDDLSQSTTQAVQSGAVSAPVPERAVSDKSSPAAPKISASCTAEEQPIFSCKLENGKQLSVCGTGPDTAEYRYGAGAAEIVLDQGEWARVGYSGGGEAQLAFTNGDTTYVVFSRVIRTNFEPDEPNFPAITDGVIVLRGQDVLALHLCNDADALPVQYDAADRLTFREELITYETSRADER